MTTPPSRQPSKTLTLRLSPAQYAALTAAARENQLSLAALSRCFVLHGLELLARGRRRDSARHSRHAGGIEAAPCRRAGASVPSRSAAVNDGRGVPRGSATQQWRPASR